MSILTRLQQLLLAREFRIGDFEESPPVGIPRPPQVDPPRTEALPTDPAILRTMAQDTWDLRNKLTDPATGRPLQGREKDCRHLDRMLDTLKEEAGVEVQDHTGDDYDPGQLLDAIGSTNVAGLQKPRVSRTLKPSIYIRNKLVQRGEVIVEFPEMNEQAASPAGRTQNSG